MIAGLIACRNNLLRFSYNSIPEKNKRRPVVSTDNVPQDGRPLLPETRRSDTSVTSSDRTKKTTRTPPPVLHVADFVPENLPR